MRAMLQFYIGLVVLFWVIVQCPCEAISAETQHCWIYANNVKAQLEMPCSVTSKYAVAWYGSTVYDSERKTNVLHGNGHIILLDKSSQYHSYKYPATFDEEGSLSSDIHFSRNDFFRCLDNECQDVEYQLLPNGAQIFRGEVKFPKVANEIITPIEGIVLDNQGSYYKGMIDGFKANGLGKLCFGPGLDRNKLLLYAEDNECPYPYAFQEGLWEEGTFISGHVRIYYQDGGLYEGSFMKGRPQGWGKYVWKTGSSYLGELNNGQRDGYGIYKYEDGSYFEGEWKRDYKNGVGILYVINKEIMYKGDFNKGNLDGYGTIIFKNKMTFTGRFINNAPHGEGIITDENDNVFFVLFDHGFLVNLWPADLDKKKTSQQFPLSNQSTNIKGCQPKLAQVNTQIKNEIVYGFNQLSEWVKNNKVHLINASKGCVAGAAGGAAAGAAGGAVAGSVVGGVAGGVAGTAAAPGPGSVVGVVAGAAGGAKIGAVAGAGIGAASGCMNQSLDAFQYSLSHGGNYSSKEMFEALKNEISIENFAYGALAGFAAEGGEVLLEAMIAAKLQKLEKVLKIAKVTSKLKAFPLAKAIKAAEQAAVIDKKTEKLRGKLSKFNPGIMTVTSWNMKILSMNSIQKSRNMNAYKDFFKNSSSYTAIYALQEIKDRKVVYKVLKNAGLWHFMPGVRYSKIRNINGHNEYFVFIVNPIIDILYKSRINNLKRYKDFFSRVPFALIFTSPQYSAALVNVHIPYKTISERLSQFKQMDNYITKKLKYDDKIDERNIVFVGDFNLDRDNLQFNAGLIEMSLKTCKTVPARVFNSIEYFEKIFKGEDIDSGTTVKKKFNLPTSNIYDHAVLDKRTSCVGVIRDDFLQDYSGNKNFSSEVSDHIPVTFVFKFKKTEQVKNKIRAK